MNARTTGLLIWLFAAGASAQVFGPAVTINGVDISRTMVQAQTDHLINQRGLGSGGLTQPSAYRGIRDEVVEQLIVQELLWQEAQRREFIVDDEVVDAAMAQIKSSFETEQAFVFRISAGGYTEQSFRENIRQQKSVQQMIAEDIAGRQVIDDVSVAAFYRDNIEQMSVPEQIRARHILIAFDAGDEDSRADAGRRIDDIARRADAGESFALLAAELSDGPSSAQGGDLGYFGRGQMVPAFEATAFELGVGEISGAVETPFGLHLIKLEDRVAASVVSLEEATPQIRAYLEQQALRETVAELIDDLRASGDIQNFLN